MEVSVYTVANNEEAKIKSKRLQRLFRLVEIID